MKKLIALIIATLCASSHAHWGFSRFGMDADQLQRAAASNGQTLRKGSSWGSMEMSGSFLNMPADVSFDFGSTGLQSVIMEMKADCSRVGSALRSAYGPASSQRTDTFNSSLSYSYWKNQGGNDVELQRDPDSCYVTLTQSEQSMMDEYTPRKAQAFIAKIAQSGYIHMLNSKGTRLQLKTADADADNCGTNFTADGSYLFMVRPHWGISRSIEIQEDEVHVTNSSGTVWKFEFINETVAKNTGIAMRYLRRSCR